MKTNKPNHNLLFILFAELLCVFWFVTSPAHKAYVLIMCEMRMEEEVEINNTKLLKCDVFFKERAVCSFSVCLILF